MDINIVKFFYDFSQDVISMAHRVFEWLTMSLSDLIEEWFDVDLEWVFDAIGDPSVLDLITVSIGFIFAYSLIKWFVGIITG